MLILKRMTLVGLSIVSFISLSVDASKMNDYLVNNNDKKEENVKKQIRKERVVNKISRIKADLENKDKKILMKNIQIKVVELTDNKGLKYIGGKVSKVDLSSYLNKMEILLGEDFILFRESQAIRDHHTFHITLVNPYEFQTLKKIITLGEMLSVSLLGLGRVEQNDNVAYFVVATSSQAQFFRTKLVLPPKDLHVTLGFKTYDVFGVSKDKTSLINND